MWEVIAVTLKAQYAKREEKLGLLNELPRRKRTGYPAEDYSLEKLNVSQTLPCMDTSEQAHEELVD